MEFDLSQALASLRGMAASFVAFLPYLAVAPVVAGCIGLPFGVPWHDHLTADACPGRGAVG